jgi:Domain of unknown function DUF11
MPTHSTCRRTRFLLAMGLVTLTLPLLRSLLVTATALGGTSGSADLATVVYPVRGIAMPNYYPRPYSTARFTIIVTNNGPNAAANVTVTNTVGFASLAGITTATNTASCSVSTGTCTSPQLPSGASMTITVTVHYKEVIHNMLFNDSATAASTTPDPNSANNSALGYYVIS